MRFIALILMLALPPLAAAQNDNALRFGEWIYYEVPAEGSEPAIDVVETAHAVRDVSVIYSCARRIDGGRESLLLLNPGFAEIEEDARFEVLFTFGSGDERAYADAELEADARHGTLDVVGGLARVLERMQAHRTFIVTQQDSPITEVAIPTDGFDEARARARERCRP